MTAQTDLRVEAAHLRRFFRNFASVRASVTPPFPLPDYISDAVLIETFEPGNPPPLSTISVWQLCLGVSLPFPCWTTSRTPSIRQVAAGTTPPPPALNPTHPVSCLDRQLCLPASLIHAKLQPECGPRLDLRARSLSFFLLPLTRSFTSMRYTVRVSLPHDISLQPCAGQSVAKYIKNPAPFNTQVVALGVDTYLKMLLTDNFVHT